MYVPTFEIAGFEELAIVEQAAIIASLVEALVAVNRTHMRASTGIPLLYQSGVRFLREPDGRDNWQDVVRTLALGTGDCEDLAAWRIAELREQGNHATPWILHFSETRPRVGPVSEYHVQVRHADGTIEDPSHILGMP